MPKKPWRLWMPTERNVWWQAAQTTNETSALTVVTFQKKKNCQNEGLESGQTDQFLKFIQFYYENGSFMAQLKLKIKIFIEGPLSFMQDRLDLIVMKKKKTLKIETI